RFCLSNSTLTQACSIRYLFFFSVHSMTSFLCLRMQGHLLSIIVTPTLFRIVWVALFRIVWVALFRIVWVALFRIVWVARPEPGLALACADKKRYSNNIKDHR
ncbi:MAG: hypothetical protein IKO00_11490, partial [Oscillospiraceae bacterium]|nr:hypothetical protein [Oscillospiraceae bacterium]